MSERNPTRKEQTNQQDSFPAVGKLVSFQEMLERLKLSGIREENLVSLFQQGCLTPYTYDVKLRQDELDGRIGFREPIERLELCQDAIGTACRAALCPVWAHETEAIYEKSLPVFRMLDAVSTLREKLIGKRPGKKYDERNLAVWLDEEWLAKDMALTLRNKSVWLRVAPSPTERTKIHRRYKGEMNDFLDLWRGYGQKEKEERILSFYKSDGAGRFERWLRTLGRNRQRRALDVLEHTVRKQLIMFEDRLRAIHDDDPHDISWRYVNLPITDDGRERLIDCVKDCYFFETDLRTIEANYGSTLAAKSETGEAKTPQRALYPVPSRKWEDLTITIVLAGDEFKVRLSAKEKKAKIFTFEQLGFREYDGQMVFRDVFVRHARAWAEECKKRLTMDIANVTKPEHMRKKVNRLRNNLRRITGLDSDPFDEGGNSTDGWQIRCQLDYDGSDYTPGNDALSGWHRHHSDIPIDEHASTDGRTAIPPNPDGDFGDQDF